MNRNGGHRNEKTISVLLAIMMIMLSLLPTMVLAEKRDKTYDVTLGEIQQELIDYVCEKKTASDTGTLVTAATINFTTAEYTTQLKCYNLDTNKFYYFRFFNNSNSDPASSMDISGSIIIDDTYV